jgi:hypothetical protein
MRGDDQVNAQFAEWDLPVKISLEIATIENETCLESCFEPGFIG